MNDHSTGDKLALQKRGEQTNAGAAKYSDTIGTGLAWAKGTLPVGTYNDLAKQVYAILRSNDPNRYEQAARALSEMMDESARQQKAFQDATEGSKVLWGDPEKAEAVAKANADAKAAAGKNNKPGKKTIGWSSGNGYMYEDDHPNNWRTSYGNSGKIKDRDTYTRGSIPGSMGLSYTEPSQVQMTRNDAVPETFSDSDWNAAHGISYVTGKDGLIYRIDPQHPNGYVDPFKNDLSKIGSTGYATGKGMLTSSSDGTYATGEGIKDANGNVLTNPGGDWEYQYALKNPQYGLGMMGKMSDAQKNYLQAVSDGMGYKYNFTGANRFV